MLGVAAIAFAAIPAFSQSLTTGDIAGIVTDPSGAVIPGVAVALSSTETGASQNTTTNQAGAYRFTLLKPGTYTVAVTQAGFEKTERRAAVNVGQLVNADLVLQVGQATQTVEVSADVPLLNTEAAQITSFSAAQVALLPSAGGDLTNIAFTAPGVVVNNTGGYGNFTVNGLPATSNLFTVNGENDMDPYFNINNSGASNLTLGQNEIQEATVISNAYSGEYGQLSGAQVTYITKSGTNQFHGNAVYEWNGRILNANDWFSNYYGAPRPFSNANQWADSIGGPIIKNRTFFFVDNEGLKFILPNVDTVTAPTPAFASAVLANIQAVQPNEYSTYQKFFNLYTTAQGSAVAQPLADSCSGLTLASFDATQPCAQRFQVTPSALASEWILAFRVDHKISDKDNIYFRYKQDRGTQPTSISPISPNFDAISKQPAWDTQINETHIFGPRATNSFMATFSHYTALFEQNHDLAYSTFPYQIATSGSVPFTGFNSLADFPQGRNISQYQFIDDYTLNRGRHNLKFGMNYRRYDVSDHNFFYNYPVVYFGYTGNGLDNFANGIAYQYRQSLNLANDVPVALWGMGLYAQDEWAATSHLKLTFSLRAEHNSNPVCQFNCFANFMGSFNSLASVQSSDPGSVPYSSDIAANQHQAFPATDKINWSPRLGFSWSPFGNNKTVVSGGAGIFYDNAPAGLVDDLLANPPVSVAIRVRPKAGVLPFDPAGGAAIWAASANAFSLNESYDQISSNLAALGSVFAAPSFTAIVGKLRSPEWQEWNFRIQQQISESTVFIANYAGNHGIRIPYTNEFANAFDEYGIYPGVAGIATSAIPNYGVVSTLQSGAVSNYNGLTITLAQRFAHGLAAHFNYTWAHNLDEASNGGVFTYGDSTLTQINPTSLRAANYGNSDYDIRHDISADFVYTPEYHFGNRFLNAALGGWQWSGKIFWRTGLPFSVGDDNTALGNYSGTILATYAPGGGAVQTGSCNASAVVNPCLNAGAFVNANDPSFTGYAAWSSQTRNQFRGPHYFDTDMALSKTFKLTERVTFGVGAQAFNVFNHPNFGLPDAGVGDSTFGLTSGMAGTPTSPYGSFLGFDSSPRVVQITGKVVF